MLTLRRENDHAEWRAARNAALVMVAVAMAYWLAITFVAYHAFIDSSLDTTNWVYNFYFNLFYPGVAWSVSPLQLLTAGAGHFSPDMLLLAPFFYAFPSALTLLFAQAVILCLTGMLVFYIAKDLTGNRFFTLAMVFAYLLSPGLHGLLTFAFHSEMFLVPFYLLVFYAYMKGSTKLFALAVPLLLLSIEEAPLLGATLAIGMLLLERFPGKEHALFANKRFMAPALLAASVAVAFFYYAATLSLGAAYASHATSLPFWFYIGAGPQNFLLQDIASFAQNPMVFASAALSTYVTLYPLLLVALLIVLFGFGLTLFYRPVFSLILLLPWLSALLLWQKSVFVASPAFEYYSFVIGPCMVATCVGMARFLAGRRTERKAMRRSALIAFAVILPVMVFLFALLFNRPFTYWNVQLVEQASGVAQNYSGVYSLISEIPPNASVVASTALLPMLANREYIEPVGGYNSILSYLYMYEVQNQTLAGAGVPLAFQNQSVVGTGYTFIPEYFLIYNYDWQNATNSTAMGDAYIVLRGGYTYERIANSTGASLYRRP